MRISLVTDSTSDIPEDLRQMHGIEVIPAILNLGSQSYEDGRSTGVPTGGTTFGFAS